MYICSIPAHNGRVRGAHAARSIILRCMGYSKHVKHSREARLL
jgi:hypothetical protein